VLSPALSAPANDPGAWTDASDQTTPPAFKAAVWDAVTRAKAACPSAWAGDCLTAGPSGIDHGYRLIAAELQAAGYAASQAQDSTGRLYDHLYVRRHPASLAWNATKLFHYGSGCLITSDSVFGVHGWLIPSAAAPPAPTPTPPPVTPPPPATGACLAPLPPKVWTVETLPPGWGSDEIGKPRWVIECESRGSKIDCTAKVTPHACGYCASIDMGTMGDNIRCGCPVRKEDNPERVACEEYLTGGTRLEARNGAVCEFVGGNPFVFRPSGGNCRLRSIGDPRVFSGWF
jgi:hypothetical protein